MSALAVITGASSGLGEAVQKALRERGTSSLAIVRRRLPDGSGPCCIADLAQPQDWATKLAPILSQLSFERLWFFDIAAVLPHGPMLGDGSGARLEEALMVNCVNPLALARTLRAQANLRGASLDIVHVSSGAADRPISQWGAYCASKAAAAMAWHVLAQEDRSVGVHIVQPGVIATAMQARLRMAGDPSAAPVEALRSPEVAAHDMLDQCGFVR